MPMQLRIDEFGFGKFWFRSGAEEHSRGSLNAARGIVLAGILGVAIWIAIIIWALT